MKTCLLSPPEFTPVPRYANYVDVLPGQAWGPRTNADPELVLVIAGQFHYRDASGELIVGPEDLLFIPPDEVHTLTFLGSQAGHFSCIHGELCADGTWASGHYRPVPFPATLTPTGVNPELRELFRRCATAMSEYTHYRDALARSIYHQIWIMLSEYWVTRPASPQLSRRMQQMLAWLQEHLERPISRKDLAREFGLAPEYVNALFKSEIGISPTQYIHRERIMRAHRLLVDEGLSVKEAAAAVGFNDPFYFSRIFKKVMGISPSAA
ncbi:MAG: helix-turn-helix transcriptional regulator [Verrucomicrobia bacterium]|jgi:AraC-like DNA-binding protein|nr:helix-turn-helix transcriptional regulator [Verrucomicrobiota bacterium]MBT7066830.1 helix-turn-helix transcriptional regulator [Verrucomicrobiota bacterium]